LLKNAKAIQTMCVFLFSRVPSWLETGGKNSTQYSSLILFELSQPLNIPP